MKIYKHLALKRKEIVILLFLSFFYSINAQELDSLIIWNKNYKLSWDDFKGGTKIQKNNLSAISFIEIHNIKTYYNNEIIHYTVIPVFNKNKSSSNNQNVSLLEHEQLHFDIHELFARKIRKEFLQLNLNNACEFSYNKIFNLFVDSLFIFQIKYDFNTNHSKIKQNQRIWNDKISRELKELKSFSINRIYAIKEEY